MDAQAQPTPAGSRFALYVLLALVVLSPWPFGSVHLRTTQAIALISLFAALAAFLWDDWHNRLLLPPRPLLWLLLGLWALALFQLIPLPSGVHRWLAPGSAFIWYPSEPAAATVLGPGPHPTSIYPEATRRWLAFSTGVVALTLAAAPALRDRRILFRATVVIVAGGLAVAVYGLAARVLLGNKLFGVFDVPTVSPFGPFVSKNHFAGYVEMTAIVAVGLATGLADQARRQSGRLGWISSPGAPAIVVAWGAAVILLLTVPVSLSRGGVLSLVVGLGFFAMLRGGLGSLHKLSARRMALAGVTFGLALLLVAVLLPQTARDRARSLTGVIGEQSGTYRLDVWRDTLRMAAGSPIVGYGFGAYEDSLPRFKTAGGHLRIQHAENDYLETLAEGGAAGWVFIAVLGLSCLAVTLRGIRGNSLDAIRCGAWAGLAALLTHGFFDFNLRIPSNTLLFVALAGLLLAPCANRGEPPRSARLGWYRGTFAPVAASILLALWTPWTPGRPLPRSLALLEVQPQASLRRAALQNELVAVIRRRPAEPATWVLLGWLRFPVAKVEASSLTRWGLSLDPEHAELHRATRSLVRRP